MTKLKTKSKVALKNALITCGYALPFLLVATGADAGVGDFTKELGESADSFKDLAVKVAGLATTVMGVGGLAVSSFWGVQKFRDGERSRHGWGTIAGLFLLGLAIAGGGVNWSINQVNTSEKVNINHSFQ